MLRSTWATFISISTLEDAYANRLNVKGGSSKNGEYKGVLHIYDRATGLPLNVNVNVNVVLDYYSGTSDGFAGFGTMCPYPKPYAQGPRVCGL